MARVVKKPEERKNELLDIALKLFMQKGYENTSVRDIYTEAKGSFGMFYHHFKSKDEIFALSMEKFASLFTKKLSSILLDEQIPYAKRYKAAIKHYIEFLEGRDRVRYGEIDISIFRLLNLKMVNESIHPIYSFIQEGVKNNFFHVKDSYTTAVFIAYGIWGNIYEGAKSIKSNKNAKSILSNLPGLIAKVLGTDAELFEIVRGK